MCTTGVLKRRGASHIPCQQRLSRQKTGVLPGLTQPLLSEDTKHGLAQANPAHSSGPTQSDVQAQTRRGRVRSTHGKGHIQKALLQPGVAPSQLALLFTF